MHCCYPCPCFGLVASPILFLFSTWCVRSGTSTFSRILLAWFQYFTHCRFVCSSFASFSLLFMYSVKYLLSYLLDGQLCTNYIDVRLWGYPSDHVDGKVVVKPSLPRCQPLVNNLCLCDVNNAFQAAWWIMGASGNVICEHQTQDPTKRRTKYQVQFVLVQAGPVWDVPHLRQNPELWCTIRGRDNEPQTEGGCNHATQYQ